MRSFQSTKRLLFDALKGSVNSTLAASQFSGKIRPATQNITRRLLPHCPTMRPC